MKTFRTEETLENVMSNHFIFQVRNWKPVTSYIVWSRAGDTEPQSIFLPLQKAKEIFLFKELCC